MSILVSVVLFYTMTNTLLWDLPGDVLAAPASALCGWKGVATLTPSLYLSLACTYQARAQPGPGALQPALLQDAPKCGERPYGGRQVPGEGLGRPCSNPGAGRPNLPAPARPPSTPAALPPQLPRTLGHHPRPAPGRGSHAPQTRRRGGRSDLRGRALEQPRPRPDPGARPRPARRDVRRRCKRRAGRRSAARWFRVA